jgi:elongation factor Ts
MANISAKIVKELRDKTDAGMMDCKKALVEAEGDMDKAMDILRKSGIAKAAKKSGRATKDGKIIAVVDGNVGVMVEALCETDFVSKGDKFTDYFTNVAKNTLALDVDGDVTEVVNSTEKDNLTDMIATIGENMQLRRAIRWTSNGVCAVYLHGGGRIGVMIEVEGDVTNINLNDICMHIAAFNPQYIIPEDIPAEVVEKEKEIATAQMAGKPAEIIDKIVSGKINKWYKEVCLMHQPWVKDDKQSVQKANPGITIKNIARWEIGEEL